MFRIGSSVALATALVAGITAAPASAASVPATKSVTAAARCTANTTFTVYTYYSNNTYTTVVGHGELDCDGNFVLHDGVQTQWFKSKTLQCPY